MNTTSFIERSCAIHADKYDYSLVNYTNCSTPVKILCKIHGQFLQKPQYHIRGSGCPDCGSHKPPPNKKTRESFIKEAIAFHGKDKFDYSDVVYIDAKTKVKIRCKLHGMFEQAPGKHLCGNGCKTCKYDSIVEIRRKPQSEFIERATKTHGSRYDYSKVEFTAMKKLVTIICKIHGEFRQKAADHVIGKGCKKCGGVYRPTTDEWILSAKEKHGDIYDYSKTVYKTAFEPVIIICKEHGEFELTPNSHVFKGHGCKHCSNRVRHTTESWIKEASYVHNNKYDYSKSVFTLASDPIIIVCPKHGEFVQQANLHATGSGCTLCKNKTESKLFDWLKSVYPSTQTQKTFDWCISPETGAKYRFDFFIPEINTIIELDGLQHFQYVWKWDDPEITRRRDVYKMKACIQNGLHVIRILQENVRCRNTKWLDLCLKPLLIPSEPVVHYISTDKYDAIYEDHKKLFEMEDALVISHS